MCLRWVKWKKKTLCAGDSLCATVWTQYAKLAENPLLKCKYLQGVPFALSFSSTGFSKSGKKKHPEIFFINDTGNEKEKTWQPSPLLLAIEPLDFLWLFFFPAFFLVFNWWQKGTFSFFSFCQRLVPEKQKIKVETGGGNNLDVYLFAAN